MVIHTHERIVVSSDWHTPYHSVANARAFCDFVKDFKPHRHIIAGDFLDFPELSRHQAGSMRKLSKYKFIDSVKGGNVVLDEIASALGPQCTKKVYMWGNHEWRIEGWLNKGDNGVFEGDPMLDIGQRLELQKRGYLEIKKYPKGVYKLGKLHVIHGQWFGVHAAYDHVRRLGVNVMFGHTHRVNYHLVPTLDGQRGGYNLGHMSDAKKPELGYVGLASGWSEGFGSVRLRKSGNFQVDLLNFVDGIFYSGDKQYGTYNRKVAA